jgi:hypothetical protein
MPETPNPELIARTFLTDLPAAVARSSFDLMARRSAAVAECWRSLAEVREPNEFIAVEMNYLNRMLDDYQKAISSMVSQMSAPAPAPAERPFAVPRAERQAAI